MYWIGFVVVCWLIADFLSGLGHWWEDRYAREEWPILGPLVATPNVRHHREPTAFAATYLSRNSTTIVPALLGVALLWLFCGNTHWLLVLVMVSQANEVHYWAHVKQGRLVEALQSTGLVQSPAYHARHHRDPFDTRYCVMSCWLNPLLDLVGFWPALEWLVFITTGARPTR